MPAIVEPSIIVDAWDVPDGVQDEFMQALLALFDRLGRLEGFLDGQILKGVEPTRFVSYARMRSARDCMAAYEDSEVRALIRSIGGIGRPAPHIYTVAHSFTADASGSAGEARRRQG